MCAWIERIFLIWNRKCKWIDRYDCNIKKQWKQTIYFFIDRMNSITCNFADSPDNIRSRTNVYFEKRKTVSISIREMTKLNAIFHFILPLNAKIFPIFYTFIDPMNDGQYICNRVISIGNWIHIYIYTASGIQFDMQLFADVKIKKKKKTCKLKRNKIFEMI